MSANFLAPLFVKFMVTCQPAAVWVSKTAWAFFTSVPSTAAGPSRYLYQTLLIWPQATIGSAGLAPSPALARCAGFVQSSAVYAAWSFAVDASAVPAGGVAAGAGEPLAEGAGDGVPSARRESVTARPWAVEDGEGEAEELAFSPVLADAEGEPEGLGLPLEDAEGDGDGLAAAGPVASWARTGRKYSLAVVPTWARACSELVPLGMLTMMFDSP